MSHKRAAEKYAGGAGASAPRARGGERGRYSGSTKAVVEKRRDQSLSPPSAGLVFTDKILNIVVLLAKPTIVIVIVERPSPYSTVVIDIVQPPKNDPRNVLRTVARARGGVVHTWGITSLSPGGDGSRPVMPQVGPQKNQEEEEEEFRACARSASAACALPRSPALPTRARVRCLRTARLLRA
eukprot:5809628-Prymnesium_polylepis.1